MNGAGANEASMPRPGPTPDVAAKGLAVRWHVVGVSVRVVFDGRLRAIGILLLDHRVPTDVAVIVAVDDRLAVDDGRGGRGGLVGNGRGCGRNGGLGPLLRDGGGGRMMRHMMATHDVTRVVGPVRSGGGAMHRGRVLYGGGHRRGRRRWGRGLHLAVFPHDSGVIRDRRAGGEGCDG